MATALERDELFWKTRRSSLASVSADNTVESLHEKILQLSQEHDQPLVIVGIFCKSAGGVLDATRFLDQVHLREATATCCELASTNDPLNRLQATYRDPDNILYLRLDSVESLQHSLWSRIAEKSDAEFLADCSKAELMQVTDLLILFNLCHLVLWLCPGGAPRVDAESLRLLSKLQELQLHSQLIPFLSERPIPAPAILLFVYADLKMPFQEQSPSEKPVARHLIETAERSLDTKWKSCLKRNLSDSKPSGLFRLQRPCVAVVPGDFAHLDPVHIIDLFLDLEKQEMRIPPLCSTNDDPLTVIAHALWPMDLFRSRHLELVEQLRGEVRKGPSLRQWATGAEELYSNLMATLEPSKALPSELSSIVSSAAPSETTAPERAPERRSDLTSSLCWWSFSELLFSLATSQKGFEDAYKSYCNAVQKHGVIYSTEVHEQQLKVAQQLLQNQSCSPLNAAAIPAMRSRCQQHFNSRHLSRLVSKYGHMEEHRSNSRPIRVCLCGKSLTNRPDTFEPPQTPLAGLPPTAPCCYNVRFLPFLPLSCDFVADPVLIPTSPRLARTRPGSSSALLPSALPDAHGFVALIADAPMKCDPVEGSRLPGFTENFQQLNRWKLLSNDILSLNPSQPPRYAYVGFEYVCSQGQRFFVPPLKNSGLVLNSTAAARVSRREKRRTRERPRDAQPRVLPGLFDEGEFEVAPLCSYRLYIPCPPCVKHGKKEGGGKHSGEPPCVAQLTRIWIQTPPAGKHGELIEAAPRISLVDPTQEKGPDGQTPEVVCTGGKVALPHDSLVQLVLPTTYLNPKKDGSFQPLPSFWDLSRSDAERCRLLPYTFWMSKPS